jgi:hypothetical protein
MRNLQNMEEKKIIKEIGLFGQEITYIVDPSLNGAAERMKVPEKYKDFNEVSLPVIQKFLKEKGWD